MTVAVLDWASAFTAAVPTLAGALVAGGVAYFAGRSMKGYEWRLAVVKDRLASRERLYGEFLTASSLLNIRAAQGDLGDISELSKLVMKYELISLQSDAPITNAANELLRITLTAHTRGSDKPANEEFFRVREQFVAAARADLAKMDAKR